MERTLSYGFGRSLRVPYEEVVQRTREALKQQGFGVISEIDVRQTMKEKRGVDFRPYVILGACNPEMAEKALEAEIDLGLLLPCNVVVYQSDGGSVVEAMDPEAVLGLVRNPKLETIAREVRERLQRALDGL